MAFHDGFDLPSVSEEAPAAVSAGIPLDCEWHLQAVEDSLTMLEAMHEFPARRIRMLRQADAALGALEELTLETRSPGEDWRTFVRDMRAYAERLAQRAERDPADVEALLELDLLAERAERAAAIARDALHGYFLQVALAKAA